MSFKQFDNPLHALIYQAECELATVEGLAMKKSSSKSDRERHVSIAAQALTDIDQFVEDLSEYEGNYRGFYDSHEAACGCTRVWDLLKSSRCAATYCKGRHNYETIKSVVSLWMMNLRGEFVK